MKTKTNNRFPISFLIPLLLTAVFLTGCSGETETDSAAPDQCLYPGAKSQALIDAPPCPGIAGFAQEKLGALREAERIHAAYPNWWRTVPDCPCDEGAMPGDWIGEPAKQEYHPGATNCYRSPPAAADNVRAQGLDPSVLLPGQQCCYDANKKLITGGAAAGTPDVHAPVDQKSFAGHEIDDVEPFRKLGWEIYNLYWPPNNGNNCKENKILK